MSPSRIRAIGPPSAASGVMWIAAGTLPEAPDMRPSVRSATLWPRSCKTPSVGVSLCNSGMPLARGPWKRTTTTVSPVNSPAWNAAFTWFWSSKTRARASTTCSSGFTADTLMTARPRLPASMCRPPVAANGLAAGRTMRSLSDAPGPSTHSIPASVSFGSVV